MNTNKFKIYSEKRELYENSNIKSKGKGTFGHSYEKSNRQININLYEL